MPAANPGERLQKLLAAAGIASRRELEAWIRAGRVTVDGELAVLGLRVSGHERILVDGQPVAVVPGSARPRTLLYHKPAGEMCTRRDPDGRPTVFERLPPLRGARWVSVGRLDFMTAGLLLLTTDGALAHALMHPSRGLEREYMVRILGEVPGATLEQLRAGVALEDGAGRFEILEPVGDGAANRWFRVAVREGRNRLVRRLWEATGHVVSRLIRTRYGPVILPRNLRAGRHREAEPAETAALYAAAGLAAPEAEKRDARGPRPATRRPAGGRGRGATGSRKSRR